MNTTFSVISSIRDPDPRQIYTQVFPLVYLDEKPRSPLQVSRHQEVLRVPANQTYGLANLPVKIKTSAESCDAHAKLALGLLDEENQGDSSSFYDWIELLPKNFANVLWFNSDQRALVAQTFFKYIIDDWDVQIDCMLKAYDDIFPEHAEAGGAKAKSKK